MSPRLRSRLAFVAKLVVASALLGWLLRSGALNLSALAVLVERPRLLALTLGVFVLGTTLRALRWRVLLDVAGVVLPVRRLLQLHFAGTFFNSVLPGGMGGDLVKAIYVARDAPPARRPAILLILLLENATYMTGLLVVASLAALFLQPAFMDPMLHRLSIGVALLAIGSVASTLLFVLFDRWTRGRLELLVARLEGDLLRRRPSRLAAAANRWIAIQRLFATLITRAPAKILTALALSMLNSISVIAYFTVLTGAILERGVPYGSVATVFALGVIASSLPISPSGLGVGHVAFERLFGLIGLSGGATVFNVFLVGSLVPSLLGIFPYLALRREGALPTREEAATLDRYRA